ncbi:ATP phosphoribosyltransferase regulatory subunit [Bacillus chungangensis]|uniref:ATP phosphoribosyltransferase regulatory subunit n=1 Tax=Bacillus chungangensis TaxID=587633 RepID=A0ABT9WVU7_9BACI|nr:ATP phosphoribosyltransferase regulatory subunit [Bacillus chungangensis]MDQ0177426.1 ATP phosphoribosyltransferase regulatory subunit [Bacillus chungangensis]
MLLPNGSRDDIGAVVSSRHQVLETFRKIITMRGYVEISTPVVEYAHTFTNEHVDMKLKNMLKWFNAEGEIEVLRPDWTTAIARALAKQDHPNKKWAYQGAVFQRDKPGIENRQVGIEIVNMPTLLGESECLMLAETLLKEMGIHSYLIELGHSEIFKELTKELHLTVDQIEKLRQAMHDKRKDEVYQFACQHGDKEIAAELTDLVDAFGSFDVIEHYEKRWKQRPQLLVIIQHLRKLALLLQACGVEDVIVDLGRVKNLPYYSGTMFRGFLKENGATCFSGGRYDELYRQFDMQASAVGLAFDVDILAEKIIAPERKKRCCIVASDNTLAAAEKIRREHEAYIVDIQYTLPKKGHHYDLVLQIDEQFDVREVKEK